MTCGTFKPGVSVSQILLKWLPLRKVLLSGSTRNYIWQGGLWPSRLLHTFRLLLKSLKKTYMEVMSVCDILSTLKWLNIFSSFCFFWIWHWNLTEICQSCRSTIKSIFCKTISRHQYVPVNYFTDFIEFQHWKILSNIVKHS